MVRLVNEFGVQTILDAIERAVPEGQADVIVSTAHKSKGRQWSSVQLGDDFPDDKLGPEEKRLLYVALTRAEHELDLTAVSFLVNLLDPPEEGEEAPTGAEIIATMEAAGVDLGSPVVVPLTRADGFEIQQADSLVIDGPSQWVGEASTLGLAAGEWPLILLVPIGDATSRFGSPTPAEREGELVHVDYFSHGKRLRILND